MWKIKRDSFQNSASTVPAIGRRKTSWVSICPHPTQHVSCLRASLQILGQEHVFLGGVLGDEALSAFPATCFLLMTTQVSLRLTPIFSEHSNVYLWQHGHWGLKPFNKKQWIFDKIVSQNICAKCSQSWSCFLAASVFKSKSNRDKTLKYRISYLVVRTWSSRKLSSLSGLRRVTANSLLLESLVLNMDSFTRTCSTLSVRTSERKDIFSYSFSSTYRLFFFFLFQSVR